MRTNKQVGRSLFLLGKHKAALDYLEEALRMGHQEDWEIWHNKGLCLAYLRKFDDAKEALMRANSIQVCDCLSVCLSLPLSDTHTVRVCVFDFEGPDARQLHTIVSIPMCA